MIGAITAPLVDRKIVFGLSSIELVVFRCGHKKIFKYYLHLQGGCVGLCGALVIVNGDSSFAPFEAGCGRS